MRSLADRLESARSHLHVGVQIFETTVARSPEATFSCELATCLHLVTFYEPL